MKSIEGKVTINEEYAQFDTLFTVVLGVPRVDLAMVYDSLLAVASNDATVERVKELLLDFNALLREETEPPKPGRLLQRRILPVKLPSDGDVILSARDTEFFIVDQEELFAAFGSQVKCLDFSLQEVCRLKPFIVWAGLESSYLSRCVQEVSRVNGGMEWPLRDPKRDIKKKAYALLRYVLTILTVFTVKDKKR